MNNICSFERFVLFNLIVAFFLLALFLPTPVNGQCAVNSDIVLGNGPCDYKIAVSANFYSDEDFSNILLPPLQTTNNDIVLAGFSLHNTSEPTDHLLLETCWTTKTKDHVAIDLDHTVIDFPGCPNRRWQSVVRVTNNGISENVMIRFPIFFIYPDANEFYLHCTVGACDNCPQSGCASQTPVKQTFTRTAAVVTLGPVRRSASSTPESSTNRSRTSPGLLVAVCILAVVIFLILALTVVYILHTPCKEKLSSKNKEKSKNVPVLTKNKRLQSESNDAKGSALAKENDYESIATNHSTTAC